MAELAELDADACIDIASAIIDDRDATIARLILEVASERELCARHIEALACHIRDHGTVSHDGPFVSLAGAIVGALLDAAASLRAARDVSECTETPKELTHNSLKS